MLAFSRTLCLLLSTVFALAFLSSINAAPIPERASSASSLEARGSVFDGNALYNFASMMGRDEGKKHIAARSPSPQMLYAPTTYASGASQLRRGNPPPAQQQQQQQQQQPSAPGAPSVPKKHKESAKERLKNGWKKFTHGLENVGKKIWKGVSTVAKFIPI